MFSLSCNLPKTLLKFYLLKFHQKKDVQTTWIFQPSKLHQKKYVEKTCIFRSSKLRQKSKWKEPEFSDQRSYIGKSM